MYHIRDDASEKEILLVLVRALLELCHVLEDRFVFDFLSRHVKIALPFFDEEDNRISRSGFDVASNVDVDVDVSREDVLLILSVTVDISSGKLKLPATEIVTRTSSKSQWLFQQRPK